MRITVEMLKELGACLGGIVYFKDTFGDSWDGNLTREQVIGLLSVPDYVREGYEFLATRGLAPKIRMVRESLSDVEYFFPSNAEVYFLDNKFQNCSAGEMSLINSKVIDTRFGNLTAEYVAFLGSELRRLEVRKSSIDFFVLSKSTWRRGILSGVKSESLRLLESEITDVDLIGCTSAWARIKACELRYCDFEESALGSVSVSRAYFGRCKVKRCEMSSSRFEFCSLHMVDFYKTDLRGSHFKNCDLKNVDFTDTDLRGVTFEDCSFGDVNLIRAEIEGSTFANLTEEELEENNITL